MAMFLTKAWGFSIPCGPLQFGMSGWRDRARTLLSKGDLVVVVGTKEWPTETQDQGRLIGLMEPTDGPVMSLDFPLETFVHDFDEESQYKWPFALINRRAWTLLDRPLLDEISSRQFNIDAAAGIVLLTDDEADRILKLRREEVELLKSFRVLARTEGHDVARRRNAPVPTTMRTGVMHVRHLAAYTYAMEIQGSRTPAFKIGWAFDHEARARQFNQYALPDIGGLSYRVILSEFWATAREAFRMEQHLLQLFDSHRHLTNREVIQSISFNELQFAWGDSILKLRNNPSVV